MCLRSFEILELAHEPSRDLCFIHELSWNRFSAVQTRAAVSLNSASERKYFTLGIFVSRKSLRSSEQTPSDTALMLFNASAACLKGKNPIRLTT